MNHNLSETGRERGAVEYSATVGAGVSFAAQEAYKRLRTNIMFSFAGADSCRIIGVTSSMRGEGKTTTSINLAYSMAEMGKHVLLIDADMRLPNIHKQLELKQSPGLSNILVGMGEGASPFRPSGLHPHLSVMTAGDIPPNPTELLSSKRMKSIVGVLTEKFDYIIIDLPPVDAVADALIVSRITHGMVVVVRQDYADKKTLSHVMEQLKFHEANVLGFVLNRAESENKYSKRYYKKNGYYKNEEYRK